MPNWSHNTVVLKGKKENILKFINEGLKNSQVSEKTNIEEAFNTLLEEGKHKTVKYGFWSERKGNDINNPATIDLKKGVTMHTFRPYPDDSYLLYDTTNCADKMPEIAKEQFRKFGYVGWYDINSSYQGCMSKDFYESETEAKNKEPWEVGCLGTKWDAYLNDIEMSVGDDEAVITFGVDTAWSYPNFWLIWIKRTFCINVYICAHEDGNAFNFYQEIDHEDDGKDYDDFSEMEGRPDRDDYDDEDDYYEAWNEFEIDAQEKMRSEFLDYVDSCPVDAWNEFLR